MKTKVVFLALLLSGCFREEDPTLEIKREFDQANLVTELTLTVNPLPRKDVYFDFPYIVKRTRMTQLPKDIGQFHNLRKLLLTHNWLENLPSELGKLDSLEELNLVNNRFVELPQVVSKLHKLKSLVPAQK